MAITMKEIAKLAGVSRPAVSAVLSKSTCTRVSVKTREKILKLAEEYDFVPNHAAQQLKGVSTHLIGLISNINHVGFMSVIQENIVRILQGKGFDVLFNHSTVSSKNLNLSLNDLRSRKVEGAIVLNIPLVFEQPEKTALPIVYLSPRNPEIFDIGTDRFAGGYIAGKHLIEHGRKKPVFLVFNEPSIPSMEKYRGFCKALKEHGISNPEKSILQFDYKVYASEIVSQLKNLKADAIFCSNDHLGIKMINALIKAGCRVPDDIAVIGFDGYSFCDFNPVPMATIVQPVKQEAEIAVKLLMERMEKNIIKHEPLKMKIKPELRASASCGCSVSDDINKLSGIDSILLQDNEE